MIVCLFHRKERSDYREVGSSCRKIVVSGRVEGPFNWSLILLYFSCAWPPSYLVKSMRMSAFPLWTSVKVRGVTSLQIFSASRKMRRTFSSPICQGNRTILQMANAGVMDRSAHTGCTHRDHLHCKYPPPHPSHLISAVITSAARGTFCDALRPSNKALRDGHFLFPLWSNHPVWLSGKTVGGN